MGLIPVAIFIAVWLGRKWWPWVVGAALVFCVGVLPTLGLAPFNFQTLSTAADRYAYLAMVGAAIFVAMGLSRVRAARVAYWVAAVVIVVLAGMSVRQMAFWRDNWRLFAYTLRVNPESRIVGAQMGFLLNAKSEGRCELSGKELVSMGDLLMGQKRSNFAGRVYEMAIAQGNNDAKVRDRLARAQIQNERLDAAVETLRETMRSLPGDAEAHVLMGDILARNDVEGAEREYREALRIDPSNVGARRGLSMIGATTRKSK